MRRREILGIVLGGAVLAMGIDSLATTRGGGGWSSVALGASVIASMLLLSLYVRRHPGR